MNISRKKFLENSALYVGGAMLGPLAGKEDKISRTGATGDSTLKLALIGCGGRGTGAVRDAMQADEALELVAMADIFQDKIDSCYGRLKKIDGVKEKISVPEQQRFVGLESYKQAIELADVVLLATPPAFRPFHFEAAVQAGKHVFMEKPLACDAPGIRKILAAGEVADQKGLKVVVGLQNRYGASQRDFVNRINRGDIGDITSMRCQYMIGDITLIPREPGQSELEYQLRNWRHFCWLWGGSPAALTLHYLDIVNWVKDTHPVRAIGTGGRAVFEGPDRGNVYDHFYIEYEYADGTRLHSTTRHVMGGWSNMGCYFQGTEGIANLHASKREIEMKKKNGEVLWNHQYGGDDGPSRYVLEHKALFEAIREDEPHNDTVWGAHSTMSTIMGRMAVHSGHYIEWEEALNSDVVLVPENLTFDSEAPVMPKEDGHYAIPIPGNKKGII